MTPTVKQPPVIWRADATQIGHAFRHRDTRTLCDRPVTPERLAWPVSNVCPVCRERAEAVA